MEKNLRNRTLALAAVFQCANAADQLARTGRLDDHELSILVDSLMARDAESIGAVYSGLHHLRSGLLVLKSQINSDGKDRNPEVMRYAISLLYLERRLSKRPKMLDHLAKGIESTQRQIEYFGKTHENVISGLASLYLETISELGPRIIIQGDERYLSNDSVAGRIRVLLLAGIRAAVLWRQAGGSRMRLLFTRTAMLQETTRLLTRFAYAP